MGFGFSSLYNNGLAPNRLAFHAFSGPTGLKNKGGAVDDPAPKW